jgi:hypothetical protein
LKELSMGVSGRLCLSRISRNIDDWARRVYRAGHDDDRARELVPPLPCAGNGARVVVCVPPGQGSAALPL